MSNQTINREIVSLTQKEDSKAIVNGFELNFTIERTEKGVQLIRVSGYNSEAKATVNCNYSSNTMSGITFKPFSGIDVDLANAIEIELQNILAENQGE